VASYTLRRVVNASAERTWDVMTDWPRHTGTVPFTRVQALPGPGGRTTGEGTGMVARTGLGRLSFDDRMTVTQWQPPTATRPGRCRLVKQGRIISGGAYLEVAAISPTRCRVVWQEHADVLGIHSLPFGERLEQLAVRVVFARALRRLARLAEEA
jgi:hypothetical protein